MIHCHLHKLVEFVKNRLIHSSNDSSTQEIITRAVQVFYDQSVSELIVNNGYLYYAKYSRRFTILDHTVPLIIKRVYRKGSSADAVLLSFMIPYSSCTADPLEVQPVLAEYSQYQAHLPQYGYNHELYYPAWQAVPAEQKAALPARFHMTSFSHSRNIKEASAFLF